ncbi:peptidoglycan/LPS O-acetylase OafA/YrhL [Povalibacter uvarum]|uniref:Peptidoglycan/LPS O-acetylase OafA/YrhL n=1 Tax=Povalibacter uvarum TaxID=732238 RepID=A0A841HI54_9GAMM|nr:acyltransferase [Povalibacter uvarum]MBB6092861.1 peptidoglycan/LPS O-acetylase OafA/YrhL [Povalibacter uvarum]
MDRLGVINGLRGLAILGTIFHHSFFDYFKYGAANNSTPWLVDLIASSGWLGVNLFFFLSGFVLYLPYASGKRHMSSQGDIREFYRRRFIRLIPLYTFVWIVSLVFMTDLQPNQPYFYKVALLYATCTYPFVPGMFYPPGNWVMWSLGAEIWFSVLFPLVVIGVRKLGWRKGLVLALILALVVRIGGQLMIGSAATPLNPISDSVIGRLDEFVIGMFAAHLYRNGFRAHASHLWIGGALVLGGALIWAFRYLGALPPVSGAFANNLVDLGVLAATLGLLTASRWWASVMQWRWLQLFGVMCYSLYMWHGILQLHFKHSMYTGLLGYAGYLAIVFAISAFTFRYIEFRTTPSWRELIPAAARKPVEAAAVSRT